jgi:hypothetical protein
MRNFHFFSAAEESDMRIKSLLGWMLGCVPLFMTGATALGGDGLAINVTNDGTEDIMVTVYDLNTRSHEAVLADARVNGFTSVPISAVPDAAGRANLAWTATSVDASFPKCGHASKMGLGNADSLNVHTDSSCGG